MSKFHKINVYMHTCMHYFRKRSSDKSDFAMSANRAYGEVKLEPRGGEGVYEDPNKLASIGSKQSVLPMSPLH